MKDATITRIVSPPAAAFEVTRNSCVVCAPLGASLAFAGVERGMVLLHGSQGCATYIRRYTISHFREPLDAASSAFTEEAAVFGGAANLRVAFRNLVRQYEPALVGVATTCLAETIGEDASSVRAALADLVSEGGPLVAAVSTPSYKGSHREGFRAALRSLAMAACPRPVGSRVGPADAEGVSAVGAVAGSSSGAAKPSSRVLRADPCAPDAEAHEMAVAAVLSAARGDRDEDTASGAANPVRLAIFPTLLSPADLRWLKRAARSFGAHPVLVSDYSDTLDGGPWMAYRRLPAGGTPVAELRTLSRCEASLELGSPVGPELSGGAYLQDAFGVPALRVGLPIGVAASDAFLEALSDFTGAAVPQELEAERSRLLDSYVDAHKIVFRKRALLYGDPDLADAIAGFCAEIGMETVLAEGEGRDFAAVEEAAAASAAAGKPVDILIGNSKGYRTARKLGVPLIRVGFPIHDRYGSSRVRVLGYGGTQELFDRITNALVERAQEESDVGYTYY